MVPSAIVEMLPADTFNAIVIEAFESRLRPHGFVSVQEKRWTRSRLPQVSDTFALYNLKSLSLVPVWGFRLDFVPLVTRSAVRWKPDPRKPGAGLLYDPLDYTEDVNAWSVHRFADSKAVRKAAATLAERAVPDALAYLETVTTMADLPRAFEEKRQRRAVRFGFDNYVGEWISYAFTLANLGHGAESREWLEKFLSSLDASEEVAAKLRQRLEQVLAA